MSEIYEFEYNALQEMLIVNYQEGFSYSMNNEDDVYSVAEKLNEQQDTIDKLKEDVQVYENTLHFICFCDNKQMEKKMLEQQSTISQLQDLCGKSDYENAKLRIENKELGDDLHNCRINKNIIREKLKRWQDAHKEYNIYNIKDFEELMKSIK